MPDPYKETLKRIAGTLPAPAASEPSLSDDPYQATLKAVAKKQRAALPFALDHGSQQDPDAKARALVLSKKLGLPVETIEADPANAARLAKIGFLDMDALRTESPTTAKWLENPNNAAIAHDDIDGLRAIERTARALTPKQPEPDTPQLRSAIEYQADRIWKELESYRQELLARPAPVPGASADGGPVSEQDLADPRRQLSQDFAGVENREQVIDVLRASMRLPSLMPQEGIINAAMRGLGRGTALLASGVLGAPSITDDIRRSDAIHARRYAPPTVGETFASTLTTSLPALGAMALSRGRVASTLAGPVTRTMRPDQVASLAKWFVPAEIGALSLAQNVQDRQQSPEEAILNAILESAFTRAGGSFEPFLDAAGTTGGKFVKEIAKETLEEGATSGSQDIVSQRLGRNVKPYDLARTLEATGYGAAAGFVFSGSFGINRAMADRFAQESREAIQAQDHAGVMGEMVDLLKSSKVNQRSPDEIDKMVDTVLGQEGAHTFVDASQFRDTFDDPAAVAAALGVSNEYATAIATDGMVQLPTVKLLQLAAQDAKARKLIDHARRTPTAKTATEAQEFEARSGDALSALQNQAKAATAEAENQTSDHDKQVAEIERNVYEENDKAAPENIDRAAIKQQAKLYARVIGSLAKRTGKTPSEIHKLKIRGDTARLMRGQEFGLMDAMIERVRKAEIPSDREAFGDSLVDFLRTKGLSDKALAGELRQLAEDDRTRKPGQRNLIRGPWEDAQGVLHQPIDLDTAAAYAHDRGYIDEATPAALLKALEDEIGGAPVFSRKYGNPEAQGMREALEMLAETMREAGVDINASNKEIRKALADYEERQGAQGYDQDADKEGNLLVQHNLTAENLLHADKLGGIAAPSLAVARKEHPLTGFGEITLLAPSSILESDKARTFDADIYSPRYPTIVTVANRAELRKAWEKLNKASVDLGHVLSSELDDSDIEKKGIAAFYESHAAMLTYLREQGIDFPLAQIKPRTDWLLKEPALIPLVREFSSGDISPDTPAKFRQAYASAVDKLMEQYKAAGVENIDEMRADHFQKDGSASRYVLRDMEEELRAREKPGVDRLQASRDLRAEIEKHTDKFQAWARDNFSKVLGDEKILVRSETSWNARKIPHNLTNVVKILTAKIRDGEGFSYGIGNLRAKVAKQFRSVKAIQKDRDRIISSKEMDAIKEEVNEELHAIADEAGAGNLGGMDSLIENMKETAERGTGVLSRYYPDMTNETKQRIADFIQKLKGLPTEYFEAKIGRAVDLSEFTAAVVPEGVDPKVLKILKDKGITVSTYKKDDAKARDAAIAKASSRAGILFQGANVVTAPKSGRLDLDAILKQWRKATGDRTPIGGEAAWLQLEAEAAKKDGVELGQSAYHGTGNVKPYETLRYDMVNAPGGEGTQNEGWGVYVTKERQAAEFYRTQNRALMGGGPSYTDKLRAYYKPGRVVPSYAGQQRVVSFNENEFGMWTVTVVPDRNWAEYDRAKTEDQRRRLTVTHTTTPSDKDLDAVLEKEAPEVLQRMKDESGRLYTVDIPDDDGFVLWDEPISSSSDLVNGAVYSVIKLNGKPENVEYFEENRDSMSGEDAYRFIEKITGSAKSASDALRALGVSGNKYRGDEASGHYNYVVFQDVPVVEYNQPGNESRRGSIQFTKGAGQGREFTINLFRAADVSTFLHESGHLFLEMMGDLAVDPKASPELVKDWQTILDWLGAKDAASITEEQHETFARGFERYLMEGKAPASNLRTAFATLKAWMVAIYKTVANLKVELTPEIRQVFDRLVAADDAATQAETDNGMGVSLPRGAFNSDEEWNSYQKAEQASRQATRDRLEGELLEDFQARREAEIAAQRAEVEVDVEREINDLPVYQALSVLQRGKLPDGTSTDDMAGAKLDRQSIVDGWGEGTLKQLPGPSNISQNQANRGPVVYASEGGIPVETFARAWGFKSGDAMIEAMIQADDRASRIKVETDNRMRALRPDPLTDGSLTDRANAALATDQRAELFRRELSALGRRTGQTPAPIEILRQVARDQIAQSHVYRLAPDKYRIAAAKAARRVVDAVSRQQWDDAYLAKTQEALSLEMYRAARDAKEASEKGRAYLRRFDTLQARERLGKAGGWEWTVYSADGTEVGSYAKEEDARDAWTKQAQGATYRRTNGYMEQIDSILDGFQLRRASVLSMRRRDRFIAWIARQQADGEPVDIDPQVQADLGNKNWTDLTVEEQAAVVDAVRNVETMAQLKNKLLRSQRERDLDAARTEIIGAIVTNQPNERPDGQFDDLLSKATGKLVGFFEAHRKDSFLARRMDGDVDGGIVWDYWIRSRNEAAGEQENRGAEESAKLSALFKEWGKSGGAFLADIPGTKMRMTTEQRIVLALNWGNKEGRQRVMAWLKRGNWHGGDAQAVLDSLDAADWKLVNGIVAQINAHWSDIAALEQRTKGIAPEKVDAVPFVTKLGVQPGGYFPIKYDPAKSTKAGNLAEMALAREMQKAAGANAQTRRGHIKLRSMEVDDLALRFDFGTIGEHLSEVIHDLTHRELILDQNRLLRDPEISQAIISRYGRGALDQFVKTATDIAVGDAPARTAAERFMKALRVNNSAATFGYNLTSALMNLTGFLQSMTRVNPRYMAQAVARLFQSQGNLNNGFAFAVAKSDFMRNRSNTLLREVADATRAVQVGGTLSTLQRWGYYPMTQVQRAVDTVTWLGAYEQALAKAEQDGKTGQEADDLAVAIADQTVTDTQGSGRIGDLSGIQRGGEISKLLTSFYSYFNVAANLQGSAISRVARDPANATAWGRLVTDTALVWTLPALFGSLIKSMLQGDDRDEEERKGGLWREQVSYGLGMLVGLREASGLVEGHFGYSGPAGTRGLAAIAKGVGEVFDGDLGKGDAKALSSLVGVFTGLPAVQINRLIDAIAEDATNGKEGEALRRALFGAPRQ